MDCAGQMGGMGEMSCVGEMGGMGEMGCAGEMGGAQFLREQLSLLAQLRKARGIRLHPLEMMPTLDEQCAACLQCNVNRVLQVAVGTHALDNAGLGRAVANAPRATREIPVPMEVLPQCSSRCL